MAKQNQVKETHPERKGQPRATSVVAVQPAKDLFSPEQVWNGYLESQVDRLDSEYLQTAQRHALAQQMGRVRGNQHLTRVVSVLQRQAAPAPAKTTASAPPTAAQPAVPTPATEAEPVYNLQIGTDVLNNATKIQAQRLFLKHYYRLSGWVEAEKNAHKRMQQIRKQHWFVGAISDVLADPMASLDPLRAGFKIPPVEIWERPLVFLQSARAGLDTGHINNGVGMLVLAEKSYSECHKAFYTYRMGTIAGAERAETTLKITAAAGAVAATIATGGLAAQAGAGLWGVSAATAVGAGSYGITQEAATQAGEFHVGMRKKFDYAAIFKRGAVDAVTTFVGALTGGALSRVFMRALGPYLTNIGDDVLGQLGKQMGLRGALPRDYFMTHAQRFMAEFLGGIGSSPFTTTVSVLMQKLTGDKDRPKTAEEFVRLLVREMVQGGIMQLFLGGFMAAHAARVKKPGVLPANLVEPAPTGRAVAPEAAATIREPVGRAATLPAPPPELASTIKAPIGSAATLPAPPPELASTIKAPVGSAGTLPAPPPELASTIKAPGGRSVTLPLPPEAITTPRGGSTTLPPLSEATTIPRGGSTTLPPISEAVTAPRGGTTLPPTVAGVGGLPAVRSPVRTLKTTHFEARPEKGGKASEGKLWLHERSTGKEYLFKPRRGERSGFMGEEAGILAGERYRRAPAAAEIAKRLGVETPKAEIVEYDGQIGSLQERVVQGETVAKISETRPDVYHAIMESQLKRDMDTFNYLIANMDAHTGNFMALYDPVTKQPLKLIPIDLDASFPPSGVRFSAGMAFPPYQMPIPKTISREVFNRLQHMSANRTRLGDVLRKLNLTDAEVNGVMTRLDRILHRVASGGATVVP